MIDRTAKRIAALALILSSVGLVACNGSGKNRKDTAETRTVTIFGLAEMRGQIEPCGCTTDPLGDLARTTHLVEDARTRGPVVVLDAGSLLYSRSPVPEHLEAQEKLKSDLLVDVYTKQLEVAAIGLGPADLAKGPEHVRPARHAANVAGGIPLEPPEVIDAGGVRVGVFGVVGKEMAPGLEVGDPVAAAKDAVGALRPKADVVVALLTMERKPAIELLRAVDGIDFAILGMGLQTPEPDEVDIRAEDIDGTWLVTPANRGQVVSKLELTVRGGAGFADAIGPGAAQALVADLDRRIAALEKELAAFEQDPTADPAFVARKKEEEVSLRAERDRLRAEPLRAPAAGNYFTLEQIKVKKQIACHPEVQEAKLAYAKAAGAANVEAAKAMMPVPPPAGQAAYVGMEACEDCHTDEVEFWKQSRHAGAWETLEKVSKQFDYECTSCHVTGWDRPGGSNMAFNEPLRDVQCETCHGPGSLHVEAETDADARKTIQRAPASDLCATQCHTKEHSDTFDYEPYLRDIVGPGHGNRLRKKLGDGPTGRELRAAGLERAGKTLGAGCLK